MEMPNLPTDNLYKFIALSGVLIFVSLIYLMNSSMIKMIDESNIIETEVDELNFEVLLLANKIHLVKIEEHQLDSLIGNNYKCESRVKLLM